MNREIEIVTARNEQMHIEILLPMWLTYMHEIRESSTSDELREELECRLRISETNDNIFFEIIWSESEAVGFTFYCVDGGIRNVIPPGYGYIMEFYVAPQWRQKNIGKSCVEEIVKKLKTMGCPKIYLTSVEESEKFWKKTGFVKSDLKDPDNHLNIWFD
ncbi:MAG: GNAT family N-acetyltransferase [Lachnospiraceae bacterium]|nr:GNAT family N-acetyltransferase [Lachnospiraceae bacterium]